jgi:hypothetical protein
MKRFLVFILSTGIVLSSAAVLQSVALAQSAAPMTEEHIERIRDNCVEAQSILNQLHASDAGLRVNRGQQYEFMSTKLMAPFNSRLALNQLDSGGLPAIASRYNEELTKFRQTYQTYEETLTTTLRINCKNQPVAFYDSLSSARQKRVKVHESAVRLHQLIQEYKTEFEKFAKAYKEES